MARESHAWPIGYGSMLLEGFVAIMAMVAAASLQPGVFFAVNSARRHCRHGALRQRFTLSSSWGFPVSADQMSALANSVGEKTLLWTNRRCSFARLGHGSNLRRRLWARQLRACLLAFWYHFAVMFEALFILTIIDAGTRVGRFMLQDLLQHVPVLGMRSPLARPAC